MQITAISRNHRIENCIRLYRSKWSPEIRQRRRVQAIRKQREFLLSLRGLERESAVRLAIADGELPIIAPELEGLEK